MSDEDPTMEDDDEDSVTEVSQRPRAGEQQQQNDPVDIQNPTNIPGDRDVLLGRGRSFHNRKGNQRFRGKSERISLLPPLVCVVVLVAMYNTNAIHLIETTFFHEAIINMYREQYLAARPGEKRRIKAEIVDSVLQHGRFLKFKRGSRTYETVPRDEAIVKVCHAIQYQRRKREKALEPPEKEAKPLELHFPQVLHFPTSYQDEVAKSEIMQELLVSAEASNGDTAMAHHATAAAAASEKRSECLQRDQAASSVAAVRDSFHPRFESSTTQSSRDGAKIDARQILSSSSGTVEINNTGRSQGFLEHLAHIATLTNHLQQQQHHDSWSTPVGLKHPPPGAVKAHHHHAPPTLGSNGNNSSRAASNAQQAAVQARYNASASCSPPKDRHHLQQQHSIVAPTNRNAQVTDPQLISFLERVKRRERKSKTNARDGIDGRHVLPPRLYQASSVSPRATNQAPLVSFMERVNRIDAMSNIYARDGTNGRHEPPPLPLNQAPSVGPSRPAMDNADVPPSTEARKRISENPALPVDDLISAALDFVFGKRQLNREESCQEGTVNNNGGVSNHGEVVESLGALQHGRNLE
jgi:hypothetical protein